MKEQKSNLGVCLLPRFPQRIVGYEGQIRSVLQSLKARGIASAPVVVVQCSSEHDRSLFTAELVSSVGSEHFVYIPCSLLTSEDQFNKVLKQFEFRDKYLILGDVRTKVYSWCKKMLEDKIARTGMLQRARRIILLATNNSVGYSLQEVARVAPSFDSEGRKLRQSRSVKVIQLKPAVRSAQVPNVKSPNLRKLMKLRERRRKFFYANFLRLSNPIRTILKICSGSRADCFGSSKSSTPSKPSKRNQNSSGTPPLLELDKNDLKVLTGVIPTCDLVIAVRYLIDCYYANPAVQPKQSGSLATLLSVLPASDTDGLIRYLVETVKERPSPELVDEVEKLINSEQLLLTDGQRRNLKNALVVASYAIFDMDIPEEIENKIMQAKDTDLGEIYVDYHLGNFHHHRGDHAESRRRFHRSFVGLAIAHDLCSSEEQRNELALVLLSLLVDWAEAEATNGYLQQAERLISSVQGVYDGEPSHEMLDALLAVVSKRVASLSSTFRTPIDTKLAFRMEYVRGYVYFQRGNLRMAQKSYARARKLYSKENAISNPVAAHHIAEVYREVGRICLRSGRGIEENTSDFKVLDGEIKDPFKKAEYFLSLCAGSSEGSQERQGNAGFSRERFRATLNLWRGDTALLSKGKNKYRKAISLYTRALETWVQAQQRRWICWALNRLAETQLLFWHENPRGGSVYVQEKHRIENALSQMHNLKLCDIRSLQGDETDVEQIVSACEEVILSTKGNLPHRAHTLRTRGWLLFHQRRYHQSLDKLVHSLKVRLNQEGSQELGLDDHLEFIETIVRNIEEDPDSLYADLYAVCLTLYLIRMCLVRMVKAGEIEEVKMKHKLSKLSKLSDDVEKAKEKLRTTYEYRVPPQLSRASQSIRKPRD